MKNQKIKEVYDKYFEGDQPIEPLTIKEKKRKNPYLELRPERKREGFLNKSK